MGRFGRVGADQAGPCDVQPDIAPSPTPGPTRRCQCRRSRRTCREAFVADRVAL